MKALIANGFLILFVSALLCAQPKVVDGGILFTVKSSASSVVLAGDFNGWSHVADRMTVDKEGTFSIVKRLKPGVYEYKFLIDSTWVLDEANPGNLPNYDNSSKNSIFTLTENNEILYHGYIPSANKTMNDTYPHSGGTLFLNLIWHQHQPLYLDPQSDQLQGPWVRTHGTKVITTWRRFLRSIRMCITT